VTGSRRFVVLRAHDRWCALPLPVVAETMRPLPIDPVPAQPPFVLGVAVIRGGPVPVVDLRRLMGVSPASPPARFVTLCVEGRLCAVAADEVAGIHELREEALGSLPPLLRDAGEALIDALAVLDRKLLLVLQAGRIIPQEVVGPAGPAGGET